MYETNDSLATIAKVGLGFNVSMDDSAMIGFIPSFGMRK